MDRWTMQELKETDDITFAICILEERRRGLTMYSPLGMKLKEAARTLSRIKDETEKYRAAIHKVCGGGEKTVAAYLDDAGYSVTDETIQNGVSEYLARGGKGNNQDIADFIEREYLNGESDDGEETDLSDCDEKTKAEILANAALLDAKDNCAVETYDCDACVNNGDCIEQGVDGEPRWKETEGGAEDETA